MGHLSTFRDAWKAQNERKRLEKRKKVETAFLPAALEIMDTPPRPTGRIITWLIIGAAAFAIIWATLSKVDIVAVAEGRVIPRAKLQSVEVAESGIVTSLLVREGDRVEKGQPLIELDPTYADADADAARSEHSTAILQKARATALLDYAANKPWSLSDDGIVPAIAAAEAQLVAARIQEHEAQLDSLYERLNAASLARRQAQTEIARINETLPIALQQLEARRELASQGFAPQFQVQELEERTTTLHFQREVQWAEVSKAEGEGVMIERDIASLKQGFKVAAARELSEAEAIIATRSELLEKAERREAMQTLTAPVSGTVNEVAITTIGEVAEPGQPLITIVPEGEELIIEAFLMNKDIGFVTPGQEAIIKFEAYSFMRYGYLIGEVEHVSPDAVIDEQRGLVFPARIKITGSEFRLERLEAARNIGVDGASAAEDLISPGLSASVEIKTGKRSVLSYLLSPVARATSEAARER